jgi:hypothetical protein
MRVSGWLMVNLSSVVVHNLHFVGMTFSLNEANPPLVVDSNRMLSLPFAPQCFQMIPRWGRKDIQLRGGVKLEQFAQVTRSKAPKRRL